MRVQSVDELPYLNLWCTAAEENLMELVYLFLVSLVSLSFLRFSAPFPFSLCSYGSSMEAVVMAGFFPVLTHTAVKG